MKKKLTVVSVIILSIILATCVLASGILESESSKSALDETETSNSLFFVRSGATSTKLFTPNGKESLNLVYTKTHNVGKSQFRDIYADEAGDYYHFDPNNNIVFFERSDDFLGSKEYVDGNVISSSVGIDTAVKVAYLHAKTMYGDIIDEFEYTDTTLSSSGNIYYVEFAKSIGEGGFINKATIRVHVMKDGDIFGSAVRNYYETIDFDDALVDGLTERIIMEDIVSQVKETYGEDYVACSAQLFKLYYSDGKYSIKVPTTIEYYGNDGIVKEKSESYLYELN